MNELDNYHIQITGPSGAGKTYFEKALKKLGYPAQDGDHIEGLGYFVDRDGNYVEFNPQGGLDWFSKHSYVWNREVLEKFLSDKPKMIICGGAPNQDETADLFDQIFYLKVEKEDILKNLRADDRENEYGKTDEQQQYASEGIDMFYNSVPKEWKSLTSRDPEKLVEEIENHLGAKLVK
jgi:shikimate kinase